ncbi:hypothetical protein GCM10023194_78740 [Planotetraspora phitsanulokensis]|uniref:Uncharacterized protein n=1 Tax=Planotetraspora phitsanulokensis TaxID=575192 RepID=A0A8J3ULZ4_9ACTN|nr:hypothetical protein [Planotetraspora phitsanulokensis]GII41160.1 hypothetical protein Pph01_61630 [Planotetraspora phitsanulokensis]
MTTWSVWRQDDNGNSVEVARYDDRIAALARALAFDAGHPHKQIYWVTGDPVLLTNRDLYTRVIGLGEALTAGGRTLSEYLRALYGVSRTRRDRDRLPLDEVAATLTAAATLTPAPVAARDGFAPEETMTGFARWEAVILSQIADLDDFALQPPGEHAFFGVDAPRTSTARATPCRWYNFDPASYLECGMAGGLGGWDESDGTRVPVPGPVHPDVPPDPGILSIETVTWDDLAEFALYGQIFE